jgi:hypothetical protein
MAPPARSSAGIPSGIGERAVRLVFETPAGPNRFAPGSTRGRSKRGTGSGLIGEERAWVRLLQRDNGELRPGQRDPQERRGSLRGGARPLATMIRYIDQHARSSVIEPIRRTFAIVLSSYCAAQTRPTSARAICDQAPGTDVTCIQLRGHFSAYGVRKASRGIACGRDQVGRLMVTAGPDRRDSREWDPDDGTGGY